MEKYIIYSRYYDKYFRQDKSRAANQKARKDIQCIALRIGYSPLYRDVIDRKGITTIADILFLLRMCFMRTGAQILIQYPENMNERLFKIVLKICKHKKSQIAVFIHDLYGARCGDKKYNEQDAEILKCANVIVSHNEKMSEYIKKSYNIACMIVNLEAFDYLYKGRRSSGCADAIIVAGNLDTKKAAYLRKLVTENRNSRFALYGVNYEDMKCKNSIYYGSYPADELPERLCGKWGLIWDGPEIDTCRGAYGNYLKMNNPHKFSLYVVSEIPLIVWKESAIAMLVKKYNIGICVETLTNLHIQTDIGEEQYQIYVTNIRVLADKIKTGFFTERALRRIGDILEDGRHES